LEENKSPTIFIDNCLPRRLRHFTEMDVNQSLPLEMLDSSILDSSLGSLRDDSEATGAASMATTSTSHGGQHEGAGLMQIWGIRTQTDNTPRRSSQRKRTRNAPLVPHLNQDSTLPLQHDINQESNPLMTLLEANPIIPSQPDDILGIRTQNDNTPRRSSRRTQNAPPVPSLIQDSTLPLQHDINQESNPLMTLLEANPIQFHPSQPDDIINFSMLNHINQQNSTLQSVSSNQNDTFSARSGSLTEVQLPRLNQDSNLPLQHDINQESNPLMTLLEAIQTIRQPDDIINFSMFNHVNQQNSTLQSVSTNQNDTSSARSGSLTVVQELGATLPKIQPFNQSQISFDDLFQNGTQKKKIDSDSVDQRTPTLSEAAIALELALDNQKKLSREVETLKKSLTCSVCMVEEVSQVLMPCGHVSCCNDCVTKINQSYPKTCPICRKKIINSQKVYFS